MADTSRSPSQALDRLLSAAAAASAVQWDVNYYGRFLSASSTMLYVPEHVYWRLSAAQGELSRARRAAMERAFL